MNNIAIIPARGGSKRIPKKNIREFCGKPIIAYSIEMALESNLFSEVMVSTDDDEIAEVAKQYGAKIPFMRSAKNADDNATTYDVLQEVLDEYKQREKKFDYGCCIYPTAPFITVQKVTEAYNLLLEKNFDTVLSIVAFSYPVWRSLKKEDDKIRMWWPENINKRSQDLPVAYHDAGQFYFFNTERILETGLLFTSNVGAIITDELHMQDIDSLQDWKLAELKYQLMKMYA